MKLICQDAKHICSCIKSLDYCSKILLFGITSPNHSNTACRFFLQLYPATRINNKRKNSPVRIRAGFYLVSLHFCTQSRLFFFLAFSPARALCMFMFGFASKGLPVAGPKVTLLEFCSAILWPTGSFSVALPRPWALSLYFFPSTYLFVCKFTWVFDQVKNRESTRRRKVAEAYKSTMSEPTIINRPS